MRDIKFRAFCLKSKEMFPVMSFFIYEGMIQTDGDEYSVYNIDKFYEVMQYTGLKDKNGVEIYEGDYINIFSYGEARVIFVDGSFMAEWIDCTSEAMPLSIIMHDARHDKEITFEVIGNIYENDIEQCGFTARSMVKRKDKS